MTETNKKKLPRAAMPEKGFEEPLLKWFEINKRELPWRIDPTPYRIWVSEIMLQQTQISAVIGYYKRFMEALPTVNDLADCPEDHLLKLWEGLGYYSRVRNMKKAAISLKEQGLTDLPVDHKALSRLPGIGPYTSGAIASMAFDLPYPSVDGNVLRVLSRLTASYDDVMDQKTRNAFNNAISHFFEMNPRISPGAFNEALMELGETICLPHGEVLCKKCPVKAYCRAYQKGIVDELPVRIIKTKRRIEEKTVFLIRCQDRVMIRRRPEKGLLAGLYEFPNVEGHLSIKDVEEQFIAKGWQVRQIESLNKARHLFSHIEWQMIGYEIELEEMPDTCPDGLMSVQIEELARHYALPGAFESYRKILYDPAEDSK